MEKLFRIKCDYYYWIYKIEYENVHVIKILSHHFRQMIVLTSAASVEKHPNDPTFSTKHVLSCADICCVIFCIF